MESTNILLERTRIIKLLDKAIDNKVVFLSSPIGTGKTIAIKQLEKSYNRDFFWFNCKKFNSYKNIEDLIKNEKFVVFDNCEKLSNTDLKLILDLIENSKKTQHFFMTSRRPINIELKRLLYNNKIKEIGINDLNFTIDEVKDFLAINDVFISDLELEKICSDIKGFPIAINLLQTKLVNNQYSKSMFIEIKESLLEYVDYEIFNNMDEKLFNQLIKISFLEEINNENVNYLLKINNSKIVLKKLENYGRFLLKNDENQYYIMPIIREYLKNKADEYGIDYKNVYLDMAVYYQDVKKNNAYACKYYIFAEKYNEAVNLMKYNSIQHLGIINYRDIEKYILKIPENIIEQYPVLCLLLAHIYRLSCESKKEKEWYERFKKIINNYPKDNQDYKKLKQMQIYYEMCRNDTGAIKILKYLHALLLINSDNNILSNITITGNQPSVISGGKDFIDWYKHYKIIYRMFEPIVIKIFSESQNGIFEIGIGEYLYQKNEINEAIEYLTKGIAETDNVDNLFVAYSILDKINLLRNQNDKIIEEFHNNIDNANAWYLLPNYTARLTEKAINYNKTEEIADWIKRSKLDIINNFNLLDRYGYFTQAKAYITLEEYTNALIILERLKEYIDLYDRKIYKIEYYILKSICLYKKDEKKDSLKNIELALLDGSKYDLVRYFADEGSSVYQILKEYKPIKNKNINNEFFDKVLEQSKLYGEKYCNKYQKNCKALKNDLTKKEKEILFFIKDGKSNIEISETLDISLATVKTHINHIYSKLETKNRVQTINLINKRNLLGDA